MIETVTDGYGVAHSVPGPWHTIAQVKRANEAAGHHFFSADAMRFFASRVAPGIIAGRFIITSEQDRSPYVDRENRVWNGARRYTIRLVCDDGTIGGPIAPTEDDHGAFATLDSARRYVARVLEGTETPSVRDWVKR